MRRRHLTLRARVAGGFLVGAIALSSVTAGATYALASSYLTRQRVDGVVRQSFNTVRSAQEFLFRSEPPSPQELIGLLKVRTNADIIVRVETETYSSSISIAFESLPVHLTSEISEGNVAHARSTDPDGLIFGSTLPANGWELFLVYPFTELPQTLSLLSRILTGVTLAAILLAGVAGWRVAETVVKPLHQASEAAQRVARGLIDTRLDEEANDELGLLAASFNQMAEALQERIARERRFVADASHELRTPLTSLAASVEYLATRGETLSSDAKSTALLALEQATALRRLVDELLELSKIESGSEELQEEEIRLSEFLGEVIRRRALGTDVRVSLLPADFSLITDKIRLERSVGNLIENAVTHGRATEIAVEAALATDGLTITVSDQGPGLRPEDLPHIFEPFWRADSTRRRTEGRGSGLGLAIARESARALRGSLEAVSSEGETKFILRLPPGMVVDS